MLGLKHNREKNANYVYVLPKIPHLLDQMNNLFWLRKWGGGEESSGERSLYLNQNYLINQYAIKVVISMFLKLQRKGRSHIKRYCQNGKKNTFFKVCKKKDF